MAKRQPMTIAGHHFATKKALLEHIRGILYAYSLNTPISDEHLEFMLGVLERHPSVTIKVGCGVARMEVRQNLMYPSGRGFWIVRTDGSETDWSFMECLNPKSQLAKFRNACRLAIVDDLRRFRGVWFTRHENEHGQVECPFTGQMITQSEAHVDHAAPDTLYALIDRFVQERGIDPETVALTGSTDGCVGEGFQDADLHRAWVAFHNEHAVLRVVSVYANLGILKRKEERG